MRNIIICLFIVLALNVSAQSPSPPKIEYPGYSLEKDVPHGKLHEVYYFSKVTKSSRRMFVYTPAVYNTDSNRKYPVLYLLHGGGEDEEGWSKLGHAAQILDNLIAEGKAGPMIVVMPNGRVSDPVRGGGYSWEGMKAFRSELTEVIIPFIDSSFKTIADKKHRAIAGLSMGGGQTFYIGLRTPGTFSRVGIFSAGVFGGSPGTPKNFNIEAEIPGILTDTKSFKKNFDLLFISVGEQDERIKFTAPVVEQLRNSGLDVVYETYPGGHVWTVWVRSLYEFAQLVFKK